MSRQSFQLLRRDRGALALALAAPVVDERGAGRAEEPEHGAVVTALVAPAAIGLCEHSSDQLLRRLGAPDLSAQEGVDPGERVFVDLLERRVSKRLLDGLVSVAHETIGKLSQRHALRGFGLSTQG